MGELRRRAKGRQRQRQQQQQQQQQQHQQQQQQQQQRRQGPLRRDSASMGEKARLISLIQAATSRPCITFHYVFFVLTSNHFSLSHFRIFKRQGSCDRFFFESSLFFPLAFSLSSHSSH